MFNNVELTNFKGFRHFKLNLNESRSQKKAKHLSLIYGCNGVGKTSIAAAFAFLAHSIRTVCNQNDATFSLSLDAEKMHANEFKDAFLSKITNTYLSKELPILKRLGSDDPMVMVFENTIGKHRFIYKTIFSESAILSEEMIIDGSIAFKTDLKARNPYLDDKHFIEKGYKSRLLELTRMYFGNHTLLSCIYFLNREIEQHYLSASLSKALRDYIFEIENMRLVNSGKRPDYSRARKKENNSIFYINEGAYSPRLKPIMEQTKVALSVFYKGLYDNIRGIDYDIEDTSTGDRKYKLIFLELAEDGIIRVPYQFESTGTKNLLNIFGAFWNAKFVGGVLVVDEIDSGISDVALKQAFKSLGNDLRGQIIATTHSTLLLSNLNNNRVSKRNVYILNRKEDMSIEAYSLDKFGRAIQKGTDVVGNFIKGKYGGISHISDFNFDDVLLAIDGK